MNKYITESLKYILRSNLFISKYYREIKSLYEMSPNDLRDRNEKLFLKLFRLAYTKSPFYNQLYQNAGIQLEDIQNLEDIRKLPIITKDMILDHTEELLTTNKWKMIKSHTSGTTGTPLQVFIPYSTMWKWQAYLNYYRKGCGFDYGKDRIVSLRGHLDRKTSYLYIPLSKTLYLSSYNLNDNTISDYIKRINEICPKAIEGYPSTLVSLCSLIQKNHLKCHIPIIFTSSETLVTSQRSFIEYILGGRIFDHYGNTERTIELSEKYNHDGYYEVPGYSINEFHNDYVITTSLINEGFPLIRYKVEDLINIKKVDKDKTIISSIDGRTMTYVTGKDGTQFNAAALTYVAKAVPDIITMQIIQNKIGELTINIIPTDKYTEESRQIGLNNIYNRIGKSNMDIIINTIEEKDLIYTKKKKLSFVINNAK